MKAVAESAPASPLDLKDFPDWLDPMVVKETRQALQTKMFLIPFVAVHVVLLGALLLEYVAIQQMAAGTALSGGERFFFWISVYAVVAWIMPLRGFEALRDESQKGNVELMLMGGMDRWRIVRGKWWVQMFLTALTLTTILPYMIVRYFFGSVEFWENVILLLGVVGCSAANSGLLIGASGYASYTVRLTIAAIGLLYVLILTSILVSMAASMQRAAGMGGLFMLNVLAVALLMFVLFTIMGLQLGRAHLKLYLLPYEGSPTRTLATMLVLTPFILLAGIAATCGVGGIPVVGVFIYSLLIFDRPYRALPYLPQNGGTAAVPKPNRAPDGF